PHVCAGATEFCESQVRTEVCRFLELQDLQRPIAVADTLRWHHTRDELTKSSALRIDRVRAAGRDELRSGRSGQHDRSALSARIERVGDDIIERAHTATIDVERPERFRSAAALRIKRSR